MVTNEIDGLYYVDSHVYFPREWLCPALAHFTVGWEYSFLFSIPVFHQTHGVGLCALAGIFGKNKFFILIK